MHSKEAMETRKCSPNHVYCHSQPPVATEDILRPALPTMDPSPCGASLHELGRETPTMSP